MGCGGSKATRIKTAPEPVLLQTQPLTQQDERPPPKDSREQPEGKLTEDLSAEIRQETGDKPQSSEDEGLLTREQISLVQGTWANVKEALELEQIGIEFYVR